MRLHIPWPPAMQRDPNKLRADTGWHEPIYTIYCMCVCILYCAENYFLHSTICPWWSGLHNYFTYSHTSSSFSLHLSSFHNHTFPHHNSSPHPIILLFFFSSLFSSVRPSLFSVSAYLSSSLSSVLALPLFLGLIMTVFETRGSNGHLDNDHICVGETTRVLEAEHNLSVWAHLACSPVPVSDRERKLVNSKNLFFSLLFFFLSPFPC